MKTVLSEDDQLGVHVKQAPDLAMSWLHLFWGYWDMKPDTPVTISVQFDNRSLPTIIQAIGQDDNVEAEISDLPQFLEAFRTARRMTIGFPSPPPAASKTMPVWTVDLTGAAKVAQAWTECVKRLTPPGRGS